MEKRFPYTQTEIQKILTKHEGHLSGSKGGEKACLPDKLLGQLDFSHANLNKADLSGANFYESNLSSASLVGTNLRGAEFPFTKMNHIIFGKDTDIREAKFKDTDCSYVDFTVLGSHQLMNQSFESVTFSNSIFNEVILKGSNFIACKLDNGYCEGTDFSSCSFDGISFLEVQGQDVNFGKSLIKNSDFNKADLNGAKFGDSNIEGNTFVLAGLSKADFTRANLKESDFTKACLKEAVLENADLKSCDFTEANLEGADLKGADLRWAILKYTNLKNADLTGANLTGVDLSKTDLSEVKSLKGAKLDGNGVVKKEVRTPSESHPEASDFPVALKKTVGRPKTKPILPKKPVGRPKTKPITLTPKRAVGRPKTKDPEAQRLRIVIDCNLTFLERFTKCMGACMPITHLNVTKSQFILTLMDKAMSDMGF